MPVYIDEARYSDIYAPSDNYVYCIYCNTTTTGFVAVEPIASTSFLSCVDSCNNYSGANACAAVAYDNHTSLAVCTIFADPSTSRVAKANVADPRLACKAGVYLALVLPDGVDSRSPDPPAAANPGTSASASPSTSLYNNSTSVPYPTTTGAGNSSTVASDCGCTSGAFGSTVTVTADASTSTISSTTFATSKLTGE